MGLNRLAAGCLMLGVLWTMDDGFLFRQWARPVAFWVACAFALLVHLLFVQRFPKQRRGFGLLLDVAGTTTMLAAGGEGTAFLYAVYLWIIIGYGFRFGGGNMVAASFLSILGFTGVILAVPFWRVHPSLSLGLLAGLAVLPAYSFALIRQLAQARRHAEQADHAKTLFLASVSHELRNPLHAIIGSVELLQGTRLDASQVEMVATINTAADGQLSLVQDLLAFSHLEAGHGRTEKAGFDLLSLFVKVTAIASVAGRDKGLLVKFYVTARTPLRLVGDERHLREVLLNLCDNAVKFTSEGSVTIAADGIETGNGTVRLRIEVMDTGIGIAPEDLGHIFKPFTQADGAIFNRFGGTGLGLALCERQVHLLGGDIGVESSQGFGSIFWINVDLASDDSVGPAPSSTQDATGLRIAVMEEQSRTPLPQGMHAAIEAVQGPLLGLPSRQVREQFATSISGQSSPDDLRRALLIAEACPTSGCHPHGQRRFDRPPVTAGALSKLRVLVADDNKVNRSVVSRILERAGFHVMLANNGEEALALLTGSEVDVALLDVNMPVMDGIETAQLCNFSASNGPRTPLIALSADGNPETEARCLQAGMRRFLVKPTRSADLISALEEAVADRTRESRQAPQAFQQRPPVLDVQTLADLQSLGGHEFVSQLITDCKHDGSLIILHMETALSKRDIKQFRFEVHALSSMSANIGAKLVRSLCAPSSSISERTFAQEGGILLGKLRHEWNQACVELDQYDRRALAS